MRVDVHRICTLVTGGVFIVILHLIGSSRLGADRAPELRPRIVVKVVWAATPYPLVIAAAVPTAIAVAATLN